MIARVLVGLVAATLVSASAARFRMLTRSGAVAAVLLGSVAVSAGCDWATLLLVFFALTTALSALGADRKRELTRDVLSKSAMRDAVQVASNGGAFALACLAWMLTEAPLWLAAGAGAIAAAAADSWATELGVAYGGEPRSIMSGKPLKRGMSGGVTPAGSIGGLVGATVIAAIVLIIGWPRAVALAAILAGVAGMITDSVLGATLQTRRFCATCETWTEQGTHRCGRATQIVAGTRWMGNDTVNALATIAGALLGGIAFRVLA